MGAVTASYLVPVPSFLKRVGTARAATATETLQIENLTCRGRANLFAYFLERDDLFADPRVPADRRLAGTGLGGSSHHVRSDARPIWRPCERAITEPYFEADDEFLAVVPVQVQGYDPLAL